MTSLAEWPVFSSFNEKCTPIPQAWESIFPMLGAKPCKTVQNRVKQRKERKTRHFYKTLLLHSLKLSLLLAIPNMSR